MQIYNPMPKLHKKSMRCSTKYFQNLLKRGIYRCSIKLGSKKTIIFAENKNKI